MPTTIFSADKLPLRSETFPYAILTNGLAEHVRLINFDPNSMEEVRLTYATPGKSGVNLFGHLMLQFKPAGNTSDLNDFIVSYRGHVDDFAISTWKGLVGKYHLQPFIFQLRKSLEEYTTNENRELISYRLNLTTRQKQDLARLVYNEYFQYKKNYLFTSRNCSTEVERLLNTICLGNSNAKTSRTPKIFLNKLKNMDFLDTAPDSIVKYENTQHLGRDRSNEIFFATSIPEFQRLISQMDLAGKRALFQTFRQEKYVLTARIKTQQLRHAQILWSKERPDHISKLSLIESILEQFAHQRDDLQTSEVETASAWIKEKIDDPLNLSEMIIEKKQLIEKMRLLEAGL